MSNFLIIAGIAVYYYFGSAFTVAAYRKTYGHEWRKYWVWWIDPFKFLISATLIPISAVAVFFCMHWTNLSKSE